MSDTTNDLERLEGLYRASTQGEWPFEGDFTFGDGLFMCFLHNAFPSLVKEIRGLRSLLDRNEAALVEARAEAEKLTTMRPASEWNEEDGAVIWWHVPVCEPPYVGAGPGSGEREADGEPTPCASQIESGWLTHWTPLPNLSGEKEAAELEAGR